MSVQNRYALDARGDDEVLRLCGDHGIAFVPFFAITGSGAHRGAAAPSQAVAQRAADRGVTPAQLRLAWTLHQGPHVLAIPGTGDPEHVEQNVAAGALRLSAQELALLAN